MPFNCQLSIVNCQSDVHPACLVCESFVGCRGACRGAEIGTQPRCFTPAVNRPGQIDPLTGDAPECRSPHGH